jgi:Uma2 family endonuclease
LLKSALQGRLCIAGIAPADVVLSEHDVVQPDVFVVCDEQKITEQIIRGAPDLVLEVSSPVTAKKDRWGKKRLYESYGVREYILIDPDGQYAERFLLESDGRFDRGEVFAADELLVLRSLEEVEIPLREVFELPRRA